MNEFTSASLAVSSTTNPVRRRVEHAPARTHDITPHDIRLLGPHLQFEQHELALQMLAAGHVLDADDVDQLVQLVGDLLDHRVRPFGDEGDARYRRIVRGGYRKGLDVVAAGREQAGYAREGAGLVLQEDGDDVPRGGGGGLGCRVQRDGREYMKRPLDRPAADTPSAPENSQAFSGFAPVALSC